MLRSHKGWVTAFAALVLVTQVGAGSCKGKPQVIIDTPTHGEFSTAPSVLVTGRIKNLGVANASLEINGVAVPILGDATWSTTVTLDSVEVFNPVLAEMTKISDGTLYRDRAVVIAGPSVADGALSDESVALRINDAGLDQIEPTIESLVNLDLATLVPPGTLVIDDFCYLDSTFGCIGRVDATVSGSPPPSISGFTIDVDSQVAQADANIDVTDFFLKADVDDATGVPLSCTLTLTAATTNLFGSYTLEPDTIDPTAIDVDQTGNVNVSFANFNDSTDCSGLLGGLVELLIGLFIGDIQALVEPQFEAFLNTPDASGDTPVAAAVEDALAGISISGPIGQGLGVVLDTPLFAVSEDTQGLTLGSDSSFVANVGTGVGQCDAPAGAPDLLASLASSDPFPAFATCQGGTNPGVECVSNGNCTGGGTCQALTGVGALPYGMGICVSRAAFNQLLKSQVECGLLVVSITEIELVPGQGATPIDSTLLSLFVPEFGQIAPGTPMRIDVRPTLAPVITSNAGPAGELVELKLSGLEIEIRSDLPDNSLFMAGQVDAGLGADLLFDDLTGSLLFQLGQPTSADVTAAITVNPLDANILALEQFILPGLIAALLPSLASDLAEFPIPSFLGLDLQGVEVSKQGDFLSIFADLVAGP